MLIWLKSKIKVNDVNKDWIEFDGNNWADVLRFLVSHNEYGEYIKQLDGDEIISFISKLSADINAVAGDVISMKDGEMEIFSAEEWKLYSKPTDVSEVERLLNILRGNVLPDAYIFEMITAISDDTLFIEPVKFTDCHKINGIFCKITTNETTNSYEVNTV